MKNDKKSTHHFLRQRLWKILNSNPKVLKRLGTIAILLSILSLTFLIRIQGVAGIPEGQFSSNDAYVFYTQAQTISKQGYLPDRDMNRWLPNGRDNRQFLSLYAYTLAWTHKAIVLFFHKVTLYQVQLYAPVICFILGLTVLLLFLIKSYGHLFAMVVGVLLATFPGTIARSTAGFSDRDAWCWMLAIFAIVLYLYKERKQPGLRRYLTIALCGFVVLLGGLSWEAFGIFVLIIFSAEIWKFCTTDTEDNLKEYILWIFMFIPWLYLISPAYRSGYGFSTYVGPLMLAPPLMLLTLKSIRYLLLRFVKQLHLYARQLAWGLTLFSIAIGGIYVIGQYKTFATTAFPFMENRLMKTVGELKDPSIMDWVDRYGSLFALGSIGIIATAALHWKWKSLTLVTGFVLFYTTIFFTEFIQKLIGDTGENLIFIAAVALTTTGIAIAATQKQKQRYEPDFIMILAWCLLWGCFTRTGIRYIFFLGIPLAVGTATLIRHIATFKNTKKIYIQFIEKTIHTKHITAAISMGILLMLLFWRPAGGYATATLLPAAKRDAIPGHGKLIQAYQWMENELPYDKTVIAAHWTYGIKLNALARVKTITDSDHYLPHWIHLYFRHVFCAQSETEALHFLKTHNATHFMINSTELVPNAKENSMVGSDEALDRHFSLYHLLPQPTAPGTQYAFTPKTEQTPPFTHKTTLNRIDVIGTELENLSIIATFEKEEEPVQLPYVAFHGEKRIKSKNHRDTDKGGLIFIFDKNKVLRSSFYIPEIGWNSLAVKLFMRGEHSNAFKNVHTVPTYEEGTHPAIQIWKINYPDNIKPHPKYLVTE